MRTLTCNEVFYLAPNGDDGKPGTKAEPWKTFTGSAANIANNLNMCGYKLEVMVAPGTYGPCTLPMTYMSGSQVPGGNSPAFCGDPNSPASVIIDGHGLPGIVGVNSVMPWTFRNLTVQSANGIGVEADINSLIYLQRVNFGIANLHMQALYGGKVEVVQSDYTIVGDAVGAHWYADVGGQILVQPGCNVYIQGTRRIEYFAFARAQGLIAVPATIQFVGASRGSRYLVQAGGGLAASGRADCFPGDRPGACDARGWIV